jgi:exosortase
MTTKYRLLIFFVLSLLTAGIFFREAIAQVFSVVIHRDGSSHGIFVPFLSLYFLWYKFDTLRPIELKTDPRGVGLMLVGLFFAVFNLGAFQIRFMAYILVVSGLVMLMLGKDMFKHTAFPVFFLITMVPIPENLYETLANYSRHIAFGGSLKIISFLGIPYFKDGWLIHLHNAVLEVAISCSGIRYLISFFVFGLAYAYITRENNWKRVLIVMLTIPISFFASIWRLTIIFFMTHHFGPFWSQHKPHVFLSWVVFAVILLGAIAIDQYLMNRSENRKPGNLETGIS